MVEMQVILYYWHLLEHRWEITRFN